MIDAQISEGRFGNRLRRVGSPIRCMPVWLWGLSDSGGREIRVVKVNQHLRGESPMTGQLNIYP